MRETLIKINYFSKRKIVRLLTVLAPVLFFIRVVASGASPAETANDFMEQANGAYNNGYHREAIELYTKVITLKPKNAWAYIGRGNAYSALFEEGKAIEDYTKAIKLEPKNAAFYYNRGLAYRKAIYVDRVNFEDTSSVGPKKAVVEFTKAIELDPQNTHYYTIRASTYDELQDYSNAISDYTKAIEIDPKYADFYYYRGLIYHKLKDYTNAVKDHTKAIKIAADQKDAHYYYNSRALAYHKLNNFFGAIKDYTASLKLKENARIYNKRGNAHADFGAYSTALKDYNKAIEIDPNYGAAYYNRATVYEHQKKYKEASADIVKAFKNGVTNSTLKEQREIGVLRENDFELTMYEIHSLAGGAAPTLEDFINRAMWAYKDGDFLEAVKLYTRAIDHNPNNAYLHNSRGNAYAGLKDLANANKDYAKAKAIKPELDAGTAEDFFEQAKNADDTTDYIEAIKLYTKAITLNTKYIEAYTGRGRSYHNFKDYSSAISDYTKAVELDPKNANAYWYRGLIYYGIDDYPNAINDYTKAIECDPKLVIAYIGRGKVYNELIDYPKAINDYTKAIEIDPKNGYAYLHRAQLYIEQQNYKLATPDAEKACDFGGYCSAIQHLNDKGLRRD